MNTGAFVCSCAGTCEIDLEAAREGVEEVDVAASSELLCGDGLPAMEEVIEEYELDQLLVTCPEPGVQNKLSGVAEEHGLHPDAVSFVDQREGAGWVHGEETATDKTARMLNARYAGLEEEAISRSIEREAGNHVAVVGDAETATTLAGDAEVTLIANGKEFAGVEGLDDVTIERGRVVGTRGEFGEFSIGLESRVTEDCISCMKCVHEGPDGLLTRRPVDIAPEAPEGEWTEVCPTDAIEMNGIKREIEVDQVIHPGGDSKARGGRIGYYTDAGPATLAAVESLLGGVRKPDFLDFEMDVCASGESNQQGCTACYDACPHDAVAKPRVDEIDIDPIACQNCGACTSACPTGAVSLREPSDERIAREVEALLSTGADQGGWFSRDSGGIENPIIAFTCGERAEDAVSEYGRRAAAGAEIEYPPILPLTVNCADTVGESHITHALACGAAGVAVLGCGCDCLHSGPDPKAELVERLNRATRDLGLGERVGFFAPEADDPEGFVESLTEFEATLDPSPVPEGDHRAEGTLLHSDHENPEFYNHGWTLESVRAILEHAEPEREVIRGLEDFGRMEVSELCTLTPTCSNLCPTDAIRRTEWGLEFNHEKCVNCGLCEEGCPESAITMKDGLDLSLLPENRADDGEEGEDPAWTRTFEGEMLECARCETPFTSKRSAEKIEGEVGDLVTNLAPSAEQSIFNYCPDCRAYLLYDRGD